VSNPEGPESAGRGMSAEHSPGPWEASIDPPNRNGVGSIFIRPAGTGYLIAHLTSAKGWGQTDPAQRAEANARLIAAAPDLLASLQELHAFAAACMRVVVKPEHAACAAALDAEVAAAGIAEGFGIRAQEALEKATVTHG
jgi:hypothetical protein